MASETVLSITSEGVVLSAAQNLQSFENKSYEGSLSVNSETEKTFSPAMSRESDTNQDNPAEGEGCQEILDRFFKSLSASERNDNCPLEQTSTTHSSVEVAQSQHSQAVTSVRQYSQSTEILEVPETMEETEVPETMDETKVPETMEETEHMISETSQILQEPSNFNEVSSNSNQRKRKSCSLQPSSFGHWCSEDPDKMFLLSMMPALKKVRDDKIDEVKLKVFDVIVQHRGNSTLKSSTPVVSFLDLDPSERAISNADGEPAIPEPEDLMNLFDEQFANAESQTD